MDVSLAGKVALVTGGGMGIGEAACRAVAGAGGAVAVVDIQPETARRVACAIRDQGGAAIALIADVTDEGQVAVAVARTVDHLGAMDVVVANAGINGMQTPIDEMKADEWRATLETNLTGTFLTVKHAIPHLRAAGGGSIIITSSMNGNRLFSPAGFAAYSTSKAGQVAFMKMAAIELARWDIRVNAILPGSVKTSINERTYQRNRERVDWNVPRPDRWPPLRGQPAEPDDVANLILFLASNASRHITGAEIIIDGGQSLLKG